MRIQVLSDLHLDFGPLDLPETDADAVVLAGDIQPKLGGLKWARKAFPSKPVMYVMGNHEYYGKSIPYLTNKLRNEAESSNVLVLENEAATIDGVKFLGCTLWTDFGLFDRIGLAAATAGEEMNDYERIRLSTHHFRKLQPKDTMMLHSRSRAWLKKEIENCSADLKVVVVTHHAPSMLSVPPDLQTDVLTAAYASNLDDFIANSGVALWVHGHIHTSADYTIEQTRVVCNPRGYVGCPNPEFNPGLVIDI
ncbi:MAG: metallophosphoesterase [Thermodesulfobacteriota bacterium]